MKKSELCTYLWKVLQSGKISDEDQALLRGLVKHHPEAELKIGVGISHFEIRPSARFKQNTFFLVRTDGSAADFSYRSCINGPASRRQQVLSAMRDAIVPQILDFKSRTLTPDARCSLTGAPLNEQTVHVDHDPPFIKVARDFLQEVGGDEAIDLTPSVDGVLGRQIANPVMARRWSDFHRQRATLFLTTAQANMRKGAGRVLASTGTAHVEFEKPVSARKKEAAS